MKLAEGKDLLPGDKKWPNSELISLVHSCQSSFVGISSFHYSCLKKEIEESEGISM